MSTELIVFLVLIVAALVCLAAVIWRQTTINKLVFKRFDVANKRLDLVEKTAATALISGAVPLLERFGGKITAAAKEPEKPKTPTEGA